MVTPVFVDQRFDHAQRQQQHHNNNNNYQLQSQRRQQQFKDQNVNVQSSHNVGMVMPLDRNLPYNHNYNTSYPRFVPNTDNRNSHNRSLGPNHGHWRDQMQQQHYNHHNFHPNNKGPYPFTHGMVIPQQQQQAYPNEIIVPSMECTNRNSVTSQIKDIHCIGTNPSSPVKPTSADTTRNRKKGELLSKEKATVIPASPNMNDDDSETPKGKPVFSISDHDEKRINEKVNDPVMKTPPRSTKKIIDDKSTKGITTTTTGSSKKMVDDDTEIDLEYEAIKNEYIIAAGYQNEKSDKFIVEYDSSKPPKRPLSAYNLFFHLERKRIVENATDVTDETNKSSNKSNQHCKPGTKKKGSSSTGTKNTTASTTTSTEPTTTPPFHAFTILDVAKFALEHRIDSDTQTSSSASNNNNGGSNTTTTKRKHRKTHGKISFTDLARTIASRWKGMSPSQKLIFTIYFNIEMMHYKKLLDIYNLKQQETFQKQNQSQVHNDNNNNQSYKIHDTTNEEHDYFGPARQKVNLDDKPYPTPSSIQSSGHRQAPILTQDYHTHPMHRYPYPSVLTSSTQNVMSVNSNSYMHPEVTRSHFPGTQQYEIPARNNNISAVATSDLVTSSNAICTTGQRLQESDINKFQREETIKRIEYWKEKNANKLELRFNNGHQAQQHQQLRNQGNHNVHGSDDDTVERNRLYSSSSTTFHDPAFAAGIEYGKKIAAARRLENRNSHPHLEQTTGSENQSSGGLASSRSNQFTFPMDQTRESHNNYGNDDDEDYVMEMAHETFEYACSRLLPAFDDGSSQEPRILSRGGGRKINPPPRPWQTTSIISGHGKDEPRNQMLQQQRHYPRDKFYRHYNNQHNHLVSDRKANIISIDQDKQQTSKPSATPKPHQIRMAYDEGTTSLNTNSSIPPFENPILLSSSFLSTSNSSHDGKNGEWRVTPTSYGMETNKYRSNFDSSADCGQRENHVAPLAFSFANDDDCDVASLDFGLMQTPESEDTDLF